MPATSASDLPPAPGTPVPAQDDAYAWLQAVEQGLSTSNTTQLALSQQLSTMQAQLKELILSIHSTSLGVTSHPSVLSNAPLLPTPDYPPTGVLPAATVILLSPVVMTIVSKPLSAIKAAPPSSFNGDQAQRHQFLMACKLYISLHASSFSDLMWTIKWALSCMNTGCTANLMQEILEDNANIFLDWAAFESWFLSEFTHLNKAQYAALMLEGTSYH